MSNSEAATPTASAPGPANPPNHLLTGALADSEREGYLRFYPSTTRTEFYDIPADWIRGIDVGGDEATGPAAQVAVEGRTGASISFKEFIRLFEFVATGGARGVGRFIPPGGGQQ
jgi:hypothetical protein